MRGLLSIDRNTAPHPTTPAGRILTAQQFATEICGGHVSAKYVIKHFSLFGSKPGKEWLWHEADARSVWATYMPRKGAA